MVKMIQMMMKNVDGVPAKGMRFERFDQPFGFTNVAMDVDVMMDEVTYDAVGVRVVDDVVVRGLIVRGGAVVVGVGQLVVPVVMSMSVKLMIRAIGMRIVRSSQPFGIVLVAMKMLIMIKEIMAVDGGGV